MSYESDMATLAADVVKMHEIVHGVPTATVTTDNGEVRTVSGTLALMNVWNPRGDWTVRTKYLLKDLVRIDDVSYGCIVPHTSRTTITEDLSKWVIVTPDIETQVFQDIGGSGFKCRQRMRYMGLDDNGGRIWQIEIVDIP